MKTLYILEAQYRDKIDRVRHNTIIGVYDNTETLEEAKTKILNNPHEWNSVTFSVNTEIQPFHA